MRTNPSATPDVRAARPVAPLEEAGLAPLPKRVAEAEAEGAVTDPVGFVRDLLERTVVLLSTLEHDVEGLRADQAEEQQRIEQSYISQQEALEAATDRLGRLQARARQIAAQKGKLDLLESALRLGPMIDPSAVDDPGSFDRLVAALDQELRAAQGITGALRMPAIGRLLNESALAVARMAQRADHTKRRLLARTEDEVAVEGKEARASFEIGLGVLERDLEVLDQALPAAARSWSDPGWAEWEPVDAAEVVATPPMVRLGAFVHPDLPGVSIPALLPATGGPGVLFEGGASRAEAVDAVRSILLRLLAGLPPGSARFSFIDPKGMGEAVAPFLGLAEYDADLVAGGALTLDTEVEEHLAELTRHVERVNTRHLQGRYASLDELHRSTGEVVEPYRYLVVFDHPTGFTERSRALLQALVESGWRAGVTVVVVREGPARGRRVADRGLPGLPVVHGGPDGLAMDVERAGRWQLQPDATPELSVAERGEPTLFERISTAIGALARQDRRAPATPGAVFDLLAQAQRRRIRADVAATTAPVDPGEPQTWWSGDASAGLCAPMGRTGDRALASLWFDRSEAGAVVVGPPGSGVSSALAAIIDGLTILYPPGELQVLLVGLGARRSLEVYGRHRLPHARLVASQAERELGLTALEASVLEVERRAGLLDRSGTSRLGLAGYRARTGEQLGRVVVVLDGLRELFGADDAVAAASGRALRRLSEDGPAVGVHLLLADRTDPADPDGSAHVLAHVPPTVTTVVRLGAEGDEPALPGDAVVTHAGATTPMRTMWIDAHERGVNLRDLRQLAEARGLTGGPQVIAGDDGAELTTAPLSSVGGNPEHRDQRRSVRLWLGEPAALGPPVEVTLRRQEGANLLVIASGDAVGPGLLHAAVATAVKGHGGALQTWVLDLGGLETGFGDALGALRADPPVRVARRRSITAMLDQVGQVVAQRRDGQRFDEPPCLFVIAHLERSHELAATHDGGAAATADPELETLLMVLRDGPEVGVHCLVWCESFDQLAARLGERPTRHFGLRVATALPAEDSLALLDSAYGASLRPHHALLADEDKSRLVKFRPYLMPPPGWKLED